MKAYFVFLMVTLACCQIKTDTYPQSGPSEQDSVPVRTTEVFGDTLKIVYEYRGDTVVQHRIDLKGDGSDDSFTVRSVWSTRIASELACSKKLRINNSGVEFSFCLDDVIRKVATDLGEMDRPELDDRLTRIMKELIEVKDGKADSLSVDSYYLAFDLLKSIDFCIVDGRTKARVKKVRIEGYVYHSPKIEPGG